MNGIFNWAVNYKNDKNIWDNYFDILDFLSNYCRDPPNIDVLMNNLLTMNFTKNFATNLSLDLIYDDDVQKRLQLKEISGVGLTMKL